MSHHTILKTIRYHKSFLAILITAFLALQWSSTHIHLAAQHDHDGAEHRHEVLSHQHQGVSHHADALDVAENVDVGLGHNDHLGSQGVVELNHDCTTCSSQVIAKLVSLFSPGLPTYAESGTMVDRPGFYTFDLPRTALVFRRPAVRAPPVFT